MQEFLPYFAGYIDGDGHFRFKKYMQNGYECFTCKIMITSTNEEPLIFFKEKIGGAYYKKTKVQDKWKDEFIYTFHVSKKSYPKIAQLEEYLVEKKDQFMLIHPFICGTKEDRMNVIQKSLIFRNSDLCSKDILETIKKSSKCVVPSKNDFIYLAGFIDAECCLTVTKKTLKVSGSLSFSCHLRCGTTKHPCIDFLVKRFGGCISFRTSKNKNWSPSFQWELTDKSLEEIIEHFQPFLIIKKDQCAEIKKMRETYISRPFPRDACFHSYYIHFTPIRESIYLTVKSLNKRGL